MNRVFFILIYKVNFMYFSPLKGKSGPVLDVSAIPSRSVMGAEQALRNPNK